MFLFIKIPVGDCLWCFPLLSNGDYQRIEIEGVVILDLWKMHDHRYELEGFFYARKLIASRRFCSTKKELYGAIQKLLQEYL